MNATNTAKTDAPMQRRAPTRAQLTARRTRFMLWLGVGLLVLGALGWSLRPVPVLVDVALVTRAPMRVTLDEEAQTRVRDLHVVSAPISGRMLRIEAKAGDQVVARQTVLAEIEPTDPAFLDVRTQAQANAAVGAAEAALAHAEAQLQQFLAEREFAQSEYTRMQTLLDQRSVSKRDFDDARRAYKTSDSAVATARAAVRMQASEIERAKAELVSPVQVISERGECECVPVFAPVSGSVLRVLHENEGVVSPGQPLIEIGDAHDLEILAEFLSTEAVLLKPGLAVRVVGWGGDRSLPARVARIEPFGFTDVSALGIEEQRVNVIIDPGDDEGWSRLGHGYRVEVQVVLWEHEEVLQVPATAVFQRAKEWQVFVVSEGRARVRGVELGQRNARSIEILEGVDVGEHVVAYPSDRISDGVKVAIRPSADGVSLTAQTAEQESKEL